MKLVEFTSSHERYNSGERAGFADHQAKKLVDAGVGRIVKDLRPDSDRVLAAAEQAEKDRRERVSPWEQDRSADDRSAKIKAEPVIPVRLLKPLRGLNVGEVCGFPASVAVDLIAKQHAIRCEADGTVPVDLGPGEGKQADGQPDFASMDHRQLKAHVGKLTGSTPRTKADAIEVLKSLDLWNGD